MSGDERILRFGWPALVHHLLVVLDFFVLPAAVAVIVTLGIEGIELGLGMMLVSMSLSLMMAFGVFLRGRRVAPGTVGRARHLIAATGTTIYVAGGATAVLLLFFTLRSTNLGMLALVFSQTPSELGAQDALEALRSAMGAKMLEGLLAAGAVALLGRLIQLGALFASWFLIPERVRNILWWIVDGVLTAAFIAVTLLLPLTPPEDHPEGVQLAAIRLSVTALAALRFFFRMLPILLTMIEQIGFLPLVAARLLRARKSGFLTVIGLLSLMAVSVSSCMLSSTLSVMGGFRNDLKRKILGNNAHVVVDVEHGTFEGWEDTLRSIHGLGAEEIRGASPYVAGEVMITSATNRAGAVLRGIDPETIGSVTDLPRNMVQGQLRYLSDPERLLHLPPSEMRGDWIPARPLGPPADPDNPEGDGSETSGEAGTEAGTETGTETGEGHGLVGEINAAIEEAEREAPPNPGPTDEAVGAPGGGSEGDGIITAAELDRAIDDLLDRPRTPPAREVLPGLIVGQELARSLRLHLGDEVSVVSPLGALGPSGLMPKSRRFRIAGIFYSGMYEYDMKMAYTTLPTAQTFLSTGDAITGIEIKLTDFEGAEAAAADIARAIQRPELRVRSWQEVNRNLFGALQLEKLAMFITLGIAILVASFCVLATLTLMAQEKRKEVGILKAMGATDGQMVGVFIIEGLLIGLLGAVIGLGLGYLLCFFFEHFGVRMNPEVYYIDRLPVHIDAMEFTLVGVASVLICVVATIYPAFVGARMRPLEALRFT